MYKIEFLVPTTHVEEVKLAMFQHGAGRIGEYQHCAWQTIGEGQFMPIGDAQPFIGEKDKITKVPEYCVQVVCADSLVRQVVAAMKAAHPYEEPAYCVLRMEEF